MRRFLILLASSLCLQIGLSDLTAQNREILGEFRIGIIGQDQDDPIYQATQIGAQRAALQLSRDLSIDVEVVIATPNRTLGADQSIALGKLFIGDTDGILISPGDSEIVRPAVEFAIEQGQEMVFFETAIEGIEPLASFTADEETAGRLAAKAILRKLPSTGRIAILTSNTPSPTLKKRLAGARAVLGYRRIEKIVTCNEDYRSAIEAIIKAEEEDRNDLIRGWLFLDDWPLKGLPALPWKPGKLPCVTIQSSPTAFLYIDQEYVDTLVVHPYYEWGYQGVETLVNKLFKDITPGNRLKQSEPTLIDWKNVDQYRQDWADWLR